MLHSSFNYLSTATIQEYLDAAQVCLTSSNGNNDVYGMAALVLLCASMDAMALIIKKILMTTQNTYSTAMWI